ncbi:hypothetical protein XELAEV_18017249mg [Xenopus laevis]|uniref:Uncharacterized protein n=1 Tax=Xenopus laevis TaxID=8355 RepID=A0A974DCY6_XENLA|nr:hypothetical protein XELAEV_18017249mg [Xenopus laevis]
MFASPVTSTPFSVKDILNLEQHQNGLSPMDITSRLENSACMLSNFKQEPYPGTPCLSELTEELSQRDASKGPSPFPGSFFVKNYLEMDSSKAPKDDKKGCLFVDNPFICVMAVQLFQDHLVFMVLRPNKPVPIIPIKVSAQDPSLEV